MPQVQFVTPEEEATMVRVQEGMMGNGAILTISADSGVLLNPGATDPKFEIRSSPPTNITFLVSSEMGKLSSERYIPQV